MVNRQGGGHACRAADDEPPNPYVFWISLPELFWPQPQPTKTIHRNASAPSNDTAGKPGNERRNGH